MRRDILTRNVALVFVFMSLLFFVPANAQSNKSISIDGHTFTAKLDDNWTAHQANVVDYNPKDYTLDSAIDWTGYQAIFAFNYKTKQSPESIAKNGIPKNGFICIHIWKLTKDYIEAYDPSPTDTLRHALWSDHVYNTKFDGKPAMYFDDIDKGDGCSSEHLAYLIDNNTVALIDVATRYIDMSVE